MKAARAFVAGQPMDRPQHARTGRRARAVLASDESSYITGQPHLVDGGMALQWHGAAES